MNQRETALKHAKNEEDRYLISRVLDIADAADRQYCLKASWFLNGYECTVVEKVLRQTGVCYTFFGGYPEAERKIFACYPDYLEPEQQDFPITTIKVTGRDIEKLSHRDYLGSLLGLGIKRETIGDILITPECGYVFCMDDIAPYILSQLRKMSNQGVRLEQCALTDLVIPERKYKELSATVSSLRLDAIVAAACGLSRSDALACIKQGRVSLDWEPVEEPAKLVLEGQLLSVKGFGRYLLYQVNGLTRKGRTGITIRKYI